ncbi:MAG: HDOD domain-containing protein [Planctomycetota bacterium]|nr:MAG: HDOD domain-containing protein [Planctomycetota bacterium]
MASLNETIAALDRLPALPATTIQLISMLAGEGRDTDLHEVEKIVSRDEAVAASVLRRANSAAFGMRGRVAGISDAIRRLGTRELCRIALETQTSGLLANAGRSYGLRRGSLSQSALGGAVAADALARAHTSSHRIDREVAFVATLLRDIGKLAIDAVAGADALEKIAAAADGRPFLAYEREVFGADHAELGAMLCQRWSLPDEIVRAVRGHHEPPSSPSEPLTDIVHAADCVARWAGLGLGCDGLMYPFDIGVRERLGTTRDELEALVADVLAATATQPTPGILNSGNLNSGTLHSGTKPGNALKRTA